MDVKTKLYSLKSKLTFITDNPILPNVETDLHVSHEENKRLTLVTRLLIFFVTFSTKKRYR